MYLEEWALRISIYYKTTKAQMKDITLLKGLNAYMHATKNDYMPSTENQRCKTICFSQ